MKIHVILCSCLDNCGREVMRVGVEDGSFLHEAVKMSRPVITGHRTPPPIVLHEDHILNRRRAAVMKESLEVVRVTQRAAAKRILTGD